MCYTVSQVWNLECGVVPFYRPWSRAPIAKKSGYKTGLVLDISLCYSLGTVIKKGG